MGRRTLVLAAIFPHLFLALANYWYLPLAFAHGLHWGWFADVLQFVIVPFACWWFLLRPARVRWCDLGLGWRQGTPGDSVSALLFAAFALLASTYPVGRLIEAWTRDLAGPSVWSGVLPAAFGPRLLVAIYMSAGAALVEEVVFRALPWLYIGRFVQPGLPRVVYLLATSAIFALCHSEQGIGGMLATFWFGLMAARTYLRQGTLWPCVIAHFTYDLIVFGPW